MKNIKTTFLFLVLFAFIFSACDENEQLAPYIIAGDSTKVFIDYTPDKLLECTIGEGIGHYYAYDSISFYNDGIYDITFEIDFYNQILDSGDYYDSTLGAWVYYNLYPDFRLTVHLNNDISLGLNEYNSYYPDALLLGEKIDDNVLWSDEYEYILNYSTPFDSYGVWKQHDYYSYLAIKKELDNNTYYGWIKMRMTWGKLYISSYGIQKAL
ncbi:hypothetical protein ACFLSE_07180 [Bacteroidota bacterium]